MRQREDPIPGNERLFRSVALRHVDNDRVLDSAVEAPATSFNREKYSQPEDVLSSHRPDDNGIVVMLAGALPEPLSPTEPGGNVYEFSVADDPNPPEDPENDAHAEVRLARRGIAYDARHRPGKSARQKARLALANKLRVLRAPK